MRTHTIFLTRQPAPKETGLYYARHPMQEKITVAFFGQESGLAYMMNGQRMDAKDVIWYGAVPQLREASHG